MNQQLQQFITHVTDATRLRGKVRDELTKELLAHVAEEERELQLQGYSEEKIIHTIQTRFGDPQRIGREFFKLKLRYMNKVTIKHILILMGVAAVLQIILLTIFDTSVYGGETSPFSALSMIVLRAFSSLIFVPLSLVAILLIPYFHTLIILNVLIYVLCTKLYKKVDRSVRVKAAIFIMALANSITWISLALSFQSYPAPTPEHYYGVGGFPLKAFEYTYAELTESAALIMWLRFYINFIIMTLFSALVYGVLPKKIAAHKLVLIALALLGVLCFADGILYFTLMYD